MNSLKLIRSAIAPQIIARQYAAGCQAMRIGTGSRALSQSARLFNKEQQGKSAGGDTAKELSKVLQEELEWERKEEGAAGADMPEELTQKLKDLKLTVRAIDN